MKLSGWGGYPTADCKLSRPRWADAVKAELAALPEATSVIPRGNGRAYGDSALNPSATLDLTGLDRILSFDPKSGVMVCESGLLLADLLAFSIPRGFFPPVVPGTKFVTLGGMVASDVHGKNHHRDGCISDHVLSLKMATAGGEQVVCGPEREPDLFQATCGGMGLTGIILEVTLKLRPIKSSRIEEQRLRAPDLERALALFESHADSPYSVAWIDCLARGAALGRSLVMLGRHAEDGGLTVAPHKARSLRLYPPSGLLNRFSVGLFNELYYRRTPEAGWQGRSGYDPYFFPLDALADWPKLYGKGGFVQHQCVLPKAEARAGMTRILERVAESGRGSFLAVLKAFGPANDKLLSFPMEGLTLTLDFKRGPGLEDVMGALDAIVQDHGGRIYLTKDSMMSEACFKAGYPNWKAFADFRKKSGADKVFASEQSRRLGI